MVTAAQGSVDNCPQLSPVSPVSSQAWWTQKRLHSSNAFTNTAAPTVAPATLDAMAPARRSCSRSLLATFVFLVFCIASITAQNDSSGSTAAASPDSSSSSSNSAPPSPPPSLAAECTQKLSQLGFQQSRDMPVVLIHLANTSQVAAASATELQLLAKGPHLPGLMTTCGSPDGKDMLDQPIRMHVRGSSSAVEYAKKSFSMDPVDQISDFVKSDTMEIPLLGLPKGKNWVLHGPENDRTLGMRNWLGYNMARWMGRYASRTQYFELFLNTDPATPLSAQHYRGVYMLQEKVSRGKKRVNVAKFNATEDMSGGYLLAYENDNVQQGDVLLVTRLSKLTMLLEYPNVGPNDPAVMWIQKWVSDFEAQLLSQNVSALNSTWLDVPAAIDYLLITEITKNPDGYRGSIKMHKDRGGPLVLGPIWDLNEAFGLCCGYPIEGYQAGGISNGTSGGSAISAAGWRFNICQDPGRCLVEPADGISQWYRKMWQEVDFRTAAAARWAELRAGPDSALRDQAVTDAINTLKALIGTGPGSPGQRNFQKWSSALNVPGFGVPHADWATMFDTETKTLTDWTLARLKWLDAAFAAQASASAGPDTYRSVGYVVAEPAVAGPAMEGPGGQNLGPRTVAGRK